MYLIIESRLNPIWIKGTNVKIPKLKIQLAGLSNFKSSIIYRISFLELKSLKSSKCFLKKKLNVNSSAGRKLSVKGNVSNKIFVFYYILRLLRKRIMQNKTGKVKNKECQKFCFKKLFYYQMQMLNRRAI